MYRGWVKGSGLVKTVVSDKETDLCIMGDKDLEREALEAVAKFRAEIEGYMAAHAEFKGSLAPLAVDEGAPPIVRSMLQAAELAGVGPMASVAGAIAEYVGRDLLAYSKEIIVENGGDIFIKCARNRTFGVYAGQSPLTGSLRFEIMADNTPLGICTSSGSFGHSLSFGKSDAACVISKDTALADAVATELGNRVRGAEDIEKGIDYARSILGVISVIVIIGDKFGSWGKIKFV